MRASANSDVKATALRIYLVHSLHQTEDLLRGATFRAEVVSPTLHYGATDRWIKVADACRRVIKYITNCQHDDDVRGFQFRGFYGLCAIDAAQEALRLLILRARANGNYQFQQGPNCINYNDTGYILKAKFVSNAIVALNSNDQVLCNLWIEASQSKHPERFAKGHLEKALAMESSFVHNMDAELIKLHRLAARSFRFAAVHSVCSGSSKVCNVVFAAQNYNLAVQLHVESQESSCAEAAPLWQKAVSAACRAAEVYAAFEEDGITMAAADFEEAASDFADEARSVPDIVACQLALKSVTETLVAADAGAKAPKEKLVWQKLLEAAENKNALGEKYLAVVLDGRAHYSDGQEVVKKYAAVSTTNITSMMQKIKSCAESAEYFKTRAKQSDPWSYTHLNSLSRSCWDLAALHMDNVLQVYSQVVLDGNLREVDENYPPQQVVRSVAAGKAACIAESVLSRAADHLDMARGCETANRSPQEAQWWRRAAECVLVAAKKMYNDMLADKESLTMDFTKEREVTLTMLRRERTYCQAAEFLRRADDLRGGPDGEHYLRVSMLYEELTVLVDDERDVEELYDVFGEVEDFIDSYVHTLTGGEMDEREVTVYAQATPIVLKTCKSAFSEGAATASWYSVLDSVDNAISSVANRKWNLADLHLASAAFLVFSAESKRKLELSLLYQVAAEQLLKQKLFSASSQVTAYSIALAVRILDSHEVPPEVLELKKKHPFVDDGSGLDAMMTHHAIACGHRAKCLRRAKPQSTPDEQARAAWLKAAEHTLQVIQLYESLARDNFGLSSGTPVVPLLPAVVEQETAVRCYMGAARAVHNPPVLVLWERAIEQYLAIELLPVRFTKKKINLVEAVKQLAAAAEAKQAEMDASRVAVNLDS